MNQLQTNTFTTQASKVFHYYGPKIFKSNKRKKKNKQKRRNVSVILLPNLITQYNSNTFFYVFRRGKYLRYPLPWGKPKFHNRPLKKTQFVLEVLQEKKPLENITQNTVHALRFH